MDSKKALEWAGKIAHTSGAILMFGGASLRYLWRVVGLREGFFWTVLDDDLITVWVLVLLWLDE